MELPTQQSEARYGVKATGWAEPHGGQLEDAARTFRAGRLNAEPGDGEGRSSPVEAEGLPFQLFRELQQNDPEAAGRFAEGLTQLPEVGSEFLGFRLLAELGRGAFGRVFLAQQGALADRPVALKIAADVGGESRALAQLQHTHIVPVYSVHKTGCLQAVCMPYLGSVTLADVLRDLRDRRALPRSGLDLLRVLRERGVQAVPDEAPTLHGRGWPQPPNRAARGSAPARTAPLPPGHRRLAALSHPEAVVWLGAGLAGGLAHAHERGILHRDLKPANVLLADDGLPLLVDFNLAEDVKQQGASGALLGGTLPYMAPEHLDAGRGAPKAVDARSDLYSLGIILYELLTGRFPFPSGRNPGDEASAASLRRLLGRMVEERQSIPDARAHNPAVAPALAAVVRRCLEPDPGRRYQTARQLQEDLQCQLEHQPLRHTPEPSARERARKWLRRHPRFWLHLTGVAALALLAVVLGGAVYLRGLARDREEQTSRLRELAQGREAQTNLRDFRDEMRLVQFLLNTRHDVPEQRAKGVERCRRALGRYRALSDPDWRRRPLFAALAPAERATLEGEVGELLLLLARASAAVPPRRDKPGGSRAGGEKARKESLRAALRWAEQAEDCFPPGEVPPVVWQQRAALLRALGESAEATPWERRGQEQPRTLRARYLAAWALTADGRYGEALGLLERATREDPRHFWAWFLLGMCYEGLGDEPRAVNCFTAAIILAPDFHGPFVNRGLAYLRQKEYRRACADFDRVVELSPGRPETYLDRALAHQGLRQYPAAKKDLDQALKSGVEATRVYFMRARVCELAGEWEEAERDRAEGRRRTPADAESWVARGLDRVRREPREALADFDRALALAPSLRPALQNKAYVLAERLGRTADAVPVLDRVLALYPDYVPARSGRAVLHARLGHRDAALRDAHEALRRDRQPITRYQAACAFALTSRQQPADAREALDLLQEALQKGFGINELADDDDLAPLRGLPAFRRLLAATEALRQRPASTGK